MKTLKKSRKVIKRSTAAKKIAKPKALTVEQRMAAMEKRVAGLESQLETAESSPESQIEEGLEQHELHINHLYLRLKRIAAVATEVLDTECNPVK
jgi:CCR4-NOT transcriptional regulation complex NOT5 subunit